MSFYGDHVYPHVNTFMAWYAGGIPGFAELLEPQYHRAQGTVLEVGIGTGATLEMFDEKKVGFKAKTMDQIRDTSKPSSLIVEDNAVAFDPNAGWKKGDMIPEYYLTRAVKGSAGDNQDAKGTWKDGVWTVLWTRKLDTGHPEDDKIMKPGNVYTFGFAVHDDNITTRGHHVSWPMTVGIGTQADI
ncbi:MAG: hypothetical protein IH820_02865 [Bacteroidetes bacterium]|nr:hypothetical protein [Bacteroidota bacterium]